MFPSFKPLILFCALFWLLYEQLDTIYHYTILLQIGYLAPTTSWYKLILALVSMLTFASGSLLKMWSRNFCPKINHLYRIVEVWSDIIAKFLTHKPFVWYPRIRPVQKHTIISRTFPFGEPLDWTSFLRMYSVSESHMYESYWSFNLCNNLHNDK